MGHTVQMQFSDAILLTFSNRSTGLRFKTFESGKVEYNIVMFLLCLVCFATFAGVMTWIVPRFIFMHEYWATW